MLRNNSLLLPPVAGIDPSPAASLKAPTPQAERIVVLDVLRGFALFGVLIANVWGWFSGSFFLFPALDHELRHFSIDAIVHHSLSVLVSGKFISIFSFLFGLGLSMQIFRAEGRGADPFPIISRRLAVLGVFGLIHGAFLWYGDILLCYSVLGFLLLLLRRVRNTVLLLTAFAFLLGIPLTVTSLPLWVDPVAGAEAVDTWKEAAELAAKNAVRLEVYQRGGLWEHLETNVSLLLEFYLGVKAVIFLPYLLGLFLIGYLAGRSEALRNGGFLRSHRRSLLRWGLTIGLVLNLGSLGLYFLTPPLGTASPEALILFLQAATSLLGMVSLATGYVVLVMVLFERLKFRQWLLQLAPVGRMALSNYLFQTIVCLWIFYGLGGLGLGWIGRSGTAINLIISLPLFGLQVIASQWWLKRFRFGPVEWLWRSATYLEWQPIRQLKPPAIGSRSGK